MSIYIWVIIAGVTSVAIEGPDKDKMVVVGDDIDTASLSLALKKKLGHSVILTVEEVKPKPPEKKPEEIIKALYEYWPPPPYRPCPIYCSEIYSEPQQSNCSLM